MAIYHNLLTALAVKGAAFKEIEISTKVVAKELACSQQTASRQLIELEKQGLIKRNASTKGIRLILTGSGLDELKEVYKKLEQIFNSKTSLIHGKVESGLGEGAYYVSLPEYLVQFEKKLGFIPFKGTLNIRVDYPDYLKFISSLNKINITGFVSKNRSFGQITAYSIKLNDISAAIIVPERTSHKRDIIEIISQTNFRKRLNLKDGTIVNIAGQE
jgi:riboflavin kinase, archaea type